MHRYSNGSRPWGIYEAKASPVQELLPIAGRVMPVKKRGAVKPRKKETAAAARKGTKGNLRAVVPTSNPTVLREVVAEGGMPTGSGQRQEAAAGSAAQMAAAAGPASLAAAAAAADRQLPTSAAPRQGGVCSDSCQYMICVVLYLHVSCCWDDTAFRINSNL